MPSVRERVRSTPAGRLTWRVGVSVVGVALVIGGVVLLPLPGPGWLVIFAGLGVLGTEFEWAARLLRFARLKVSAWASWVARQSLPVQLLIGTTGLILIACAVGAAWWYYTR